MIEGELVQLDGDSAADTSASISVAAAAGSWSAAAMSASTQCFSIKDVTAGGTTYAQSSVTGALAGAGCNGTQAGTSATPS